MMKTALSLALVMLATGFGVQAGEQTDKLHHGEAIHSRHCVKCHDDQVYTRDDRRVKSLQALGTQVRRCRDNLGMQWFDEDTEAVVHFLNSKYYKF